MRTRWRSALWLAAMAASVAPSSAPAAAQPSKNMEDIIVTARKRRETILKTPVIETVLTGARLQRFADLSVKTAVKEVPDVVIGQALGAFGAQISLRGVGTTTLNAAVDQSVSLNLDGLQVTQGIAFQSALFDVARVETLKGPQALFYGKSSTAGVISLTSNDPTDKYEVIARTGYEFEAAQRRADIIVSGPVTDTLGMRLATSFGAQDGYFDNVAMGIPATGSLTPRYSDAPEFDYLGRFTAVWKPIPAFESRLKLNFQRSNTNGEGSGVEITSCPGGITNSYGIPFLSGPCGISRNIRVVDANPAAFPGIRDEGTPFNNYDLFYGTWENNYHPLPNLTLTSVTGLFTLHDADDINGLDTQEAGPPLTADDNFYRRELTEELRVTSDFSGPLNFAAGAFIEDGKMLTNVDLRGNTFLGLPATIPTQWGQHAMNIDSQSLFGQAIWKIVPRVEFSAGARWTHEDRTDDVTDNANGERIAIGDPKIASNHISPEVSLTYRPTDELTLYGSFREAAKSGSYTTDTIPAPGETVGFGDETVRGGEFGIKGLLFNRALRFNIDAYRYSYANLQVGTNIVEPSGLVNDLTLNAASALVQGIEADGTYQVPFMEYLSLRGAIALNEARYSKFGNAPCAGGQTIAQGCNAGFDSKTGLFTSQSLSGRPLLRAPNFTANFGFDYTMPVMNAWTLTLSSNTNFSAAYYTDLIERADTIQPSFFKTDASLTLTSPNQRWEFSFVGNNLNNALTTGNCVNAPLKYGDIFAPPGGQISGGATSGPGGPDALGCYIDPGRALWLRATWHFIGG